MTRPEVEAFLARHKQSFDSRSASTLAADHTENGTMRTQAEGTVAGRAEIQKVYEYWLTSFPDMDFDWESPIVEGDRVAFLWHFGGTVSAPGAGKLIDRVLTYLQVPPSPELAPPPPHIAAKLVNYDPKVYRWPDSDAQHAADARH